MWRFVVVSVAFLGWSFYELSGGSEYAPAENSLQVALKGKPIFAEPLPVAFTEIVVLDDAGLPPPIVPRSKTRKAKPKPTAAEIAAAEEEEIRLGMESLASLSTASIDRFSITLASISDEALEPPQSGLSIEGIGGFSGAALARDVGDETSVVDTPVVEATIQEPLPEPADMRKISRTVANMRDGPGTSFEKIDQLSNGTVVEVLETADNGWLRLKVMSTGREGWMADWLVTASN